MAAKRRGAAAVVAGTHVTWCGVRAVVTTTWVAAVVVSAGGNTCGLRAMPATPVGARAIVTIAARGGQRARQTALSSTAGPYHTHTHRVCTNNVSCTRGRPFFVVYIMQAILASLRVVGWTSNFLYSFNHNIII